MTEKKQGRHQRKKIIDFVLRYTAEHRYSPTIQEIANDRGISPTSIRKHLRRMEADGLVSRDPLRPRSLVICEKE